MAIKLSLGNVGSGKTATVVREMFNSPYKTYTNIQTNIPKCVLIKPEMIMNKIITGTKKDGTETFKLELNKEFWQSIKEPINVVLDEAHAIINSRRGASKCNIVVTDWIALIRRALGNDPVKQGDLTLISQLPRRLDVIAREMATQITFHKCHYVKKCKNKACQCSWREDSNYPEPIKMCPYCGSTEISKTEHTIEIWKFANLRDFLLWEEDNTQQTFYAHRLIYDIEKTFVMYNTLQWDNMFSNMY